MDMNMIIQVNVTIRQKVLRLVRHKLVQKLQNEQNRTKLKFSS